MVSQYPQFHLIAQEDVQGLRVPIVFYRREAL